MPVKLVAQPLSPGFFESRDGTRVTWLGMAGILVNARGTIVFVDPLLTLVERDGRILSESGNRMIVDIPIASGRVPRADVVCYTHADDDHCMEPTAVEFGGRLACRFLAPPPVLERLRKAGLGPAGFTTAADFGVHRFGNVEITVTPALHDWDKPAPWQRGDCVGYLIKTPDGTIWHPGDSRLIPELETVRGVDLLFFDVADVEAHLGPRGSARLAETSGAKVMVAYHYGTFDLPAGSWGGCDPADSLPFVKGLSAKFIAPNPGEVISL